jgi:5-methyltetrahydrofolate--homocysteine methyltransferase
MKEKLVDAIANMREDEVEKLTQELLDAGEEPRIALDALREGMAIIGQRYEEKEYFLPHLVIAGDLVKKVADLVKPRLQQAAAETQPLGRVIIGTVAGDIHDIGKDIVAFMLDVNNFEVHDLGIDVPAEKFVDKIKEVNPDIVAMSGFLTLAFDQMRDTVAAIKEAGLRDGVKIMIGGAPMDSNVAAYIGADAFGPDASAAVKLAKNWTGGK